MNRRSFVATFAAGAATLAQPSASPAQATWTPKDWRLADFHALASDPAQVRYLFDVTRINEGAFLTAINNALNGLISGFAINPARIRIVAALHGPANLLNFDDFIWSKYSIGAWLGVADPVTQQPATRNPFCCEVARSAETSSIEGLRHRRVKFLCCHTALEDQVATLIRLRNLRAEHEAIVQEMLAHLLPDVLVVPSMGAAIALLQTDGRYAYIAV